MTSGPVHTGPRPGLRQMIAARDCPQADVPAPGSALDAQFLELIALEEFSPGFVGSCAALYVADAVPKITHLSEALASDAPPDFEAAEAAAHQLKGSSASLGAGGMAALCAGVRGACLRRDAAGARRLVEQMQDHFLEVQAELAKWLDSSDPRCQQAPPRQREAR